MFELIKNYFFSITDNIDNIKIEDIVTYKDKKISIVVDNRGKYMASFEILRDYTYDFLIVDVSNERIIVTKTKKFWNDEDLYKEINDDLNILNSM